MEERTVGPGLGQDSIEKGELAAYVGSILVIVFMLITYRLFGVFANIAVVVNVAMIFGVLSLLNATLTLPGIAGVILNRVGSARKRSAHLRHEDDLCTQRLHHPRPFAGRHDEPYYPVNTAEDRAILLKILHRWRRTTRPIQVFGAG